MLLCSAHDLATSSSCVCVCLLTWFYNVRCRCRNTANKPSVATRSKNNNKKYILRTMQYLKWKAKANTHTSHVNFLDYCIYFTKVHNWHDQSRHQLDVRSVLSYICTFTTSNKKKYKSKKVLWMKIYDSCTSGVPEHVICVIYSRVLWERLHAF